MNGLDFHMPTTATKRQRVSTSTNPFIIPFIIHLTMPYSFLSEKLKIATQRESTHRLMKYNHFLD